MGRRIGADELQGQGITAEARRAQRGDRKCRITAENAKNAEGHEIRQTNWGRRIAGVRRMGHCDRVMGTRRFWLVIGVALFVGVLALGAFRNREPEYDGRKLSYWVDHYYTRTNPPRFSNSIGMLTIENEAATNAI